jgi:hypothetical protein
MRLAVAGIVSFLVMPIACTSSPPPQDTPCQPQTPLSDAAGAGSGYPIEALPTGSCVGSASCQMTIIKPCDAGPPLYDEYACQCANGSWACVDKYPDLAVCQLAPPIDAGKDSAPDGASEASSLDAASEASDN